MLTESLNSRDGTIGRLIHDPAVYDNLNRLLCNSNQVVLQINQIALRLRPIVDDVRVFTDKIARDPRQLGVKGALDQTPSGQGSKHGLPTEPSMGGGIFHQEGFYR